MRRTRPWLLISLLALLACGLVAAGCGDDDETTSGSGSTETTASGDFTTISDGTLLIAVDAPYPPFEIGTPDDADFSGVDVDVGKEISERLGLTPEFVDTSFDTIFRNTAAGQFDVAIAASTITPGRQKTVNFSDPYYEAQQALVVPEGSDIATVEDLAGKTVAAQDATTGETLANEESDAAEVRGLPEGPDVIAAVVTGQVEAGIIDEPVAVDAVDKGQPVEIATTIPTAELYGIAISKENPELLEAVNGALQEMKDDGTIQGLYDKYLGGNEAPESVLNGTTQNPG
jgi:polar amino acid transport system substrate-binding protein